MLASDGARYQVPLLDGDATTAYQLFACLMYFLGVPLELHRLFALVVRSPSLHLQLKFYDQPLPLLRAWHEQLVPLFGAPPTSSRSTLSSNLLYIRLLSRGRHSGVLAL